MARFLRDGYYLFSSPISGLW